VDGCRGFTTGEQERTTDVSVPPNMNGDRDDKVVELHPGASKPEPTMTWSVKDAEGNVVSTVKMSDGHYECVLADGTIVEKFNNLTYALEFLKGRTSPLLPEERKARLVREVKQLARQDSTEWRISLRDLAVRHDTPEAELEKMFAAQIKADEKEAREAKAEQRRREQRAEKKEKKESTTRREEERKRQRDDKETERARKEAERIEREQEKRRKKLETVFAEIADLPRMTHAMRLKEAAARLGEDLETLIEEFEVFFAARSLPAELLPWPDPVETAELLAGIEAKFRRYVVAPDAITAATTLWVPFTYLVEIAVYAPKLLFQFPERDAGKSTALDVIRWMVQRPYLAIEATGAAIYRIVNRLKPTLILDEADTLFERSTVLAHIINESWSNRGAKIPRADKHGSFVEYDIYGTQAIGMKGLNMPDTTLSRCVICMIWPKLPSEVVDDFSKRDDEEFVTLRRKLLRWSVDNAVTLRAATPEGQFNNRIRNNWQLLWAIADLAGGEWPKRARAAALELETERDEPSEGLRLLAALRNIFGARKAMTSADICAALVADPSGEWANFRGKGPISQTQLAVMLKEYRIRTEKVSPAGIRLNGYFRAQFENAFARLLQNPTREPDNRTEPAAKAKPQKSGKKSRSRKK
jgi:Protein of unknown function (DUF3631)